MAGEQVWTPDAVTRAAGEAARRVVRYAGATPVAAGVQTAPPPAVEALRRALVRGLAGVPSVGAVRPSSRIVTASTRDPHRNGFALDVMLRAGADRHARGAAIASWLVRHAERLGLQYVLFAGYEWSASGSGAAWERYTGSDPHDDHVHAEAGPDARRWTAADMESRVAVALAELGGDPSSAWVVVAMLAAAAGLALAPRMIGG